MEASDQLWMSRYLLSRCAERLGIVASLEPKPVPGDWGGSGAFVRYSTAETREPEQGWDAIQRHMLFLSASHLSHTQVRSEVSFICMLYTLEEALQHNTAIL